MLINQYGRYKMVNKKDLLATVPKRLKYIFFISTLLFLYCTDKQFRIEKKMENGVEVVINHLEPYKIKGGPSNFTLEERLVISQKRKDLIDKGIMSMGEFDVDSEGNIYIVGYKNIDNFICKLDQEGKFVTSFGRKGQGPGELEMPIRPVVFGDRIAITDWNKKLVIFSNNGGLVEEKYFKHRINEADVLENGKYLFYGWLGEYKTYDYALEILSLFDSEFKKIKDLDVYKLHYRNEKLAPFFMWRVVNGHIYIVNEERGYEILVYDIDGNCVRKIRKEYRPVSLTEEIKELIIGPHYKQIGKIKKGYIPDPLPPIRFFFTDDEGTLFVMTYEKGKKPREYMYDIFNSKGIFIGRKSLNLPWEGKYFGPKTEMVKKNHLYCYREDENGFKELVVYKLNWVY